MNKYSLNNDWQVTEGNLQNPLMMNMLSGWEKCRLPHDYQITKERTSDSLAAENEGWTQGAALFYRKEFILKPEVENKRIWLELEGVAGICEIWVNGKFAAKHMNPYTGIFVEITDLICIGENTVQVHVDSRMKPNSRWYVGTGLYRRAWLHISEQTTIAPETLHVTTKSIAGSTAEIEISAQIAGNADRVLYEIIDKSGNTVVSANAVTNENCAMASLVAKGIVPWNPGKPELYTVRATVYEKGLLDTTEILTGFRTIEVNPREGFKLNGVPMKLKGGCVHHDLGMLGAAEYEAANRRRIKTLKKNGFNALRGAHNPFGPGFYEICDEMGMLVIEEAFDEWVLGRTDFGLHITFEDCWERDLDDMIRRDYNHPSIIMWSTGNEVEERDGSADGYAWSRQLAEKVHSLDQTRPVSASACSLFIEYTQRPSPDADKGVTGNQALNMAYDTFAEGRDLWGPATEKYFAPLDVAGYNYKTARYAYDGEKYPNRVIYGSESYPRAAFQSWQGVMEHPHVIGDFVWTAWEYLGEVGIGRWEISKNSRPGTAGYPWLLAYCSDFDLLGDKRPQSYYRDAVWGISQGPKIFCLPPELVGKKIARLSWGWLPVQRNYTFNGCEGQQVEVHVYADAEEIELFQNGKSVAKAPCGKKEEYLAAFTVTYQPGSISVIARRNGTEIGRDVLYTADPTATLSLQADRAEILGDGEDLSFLTIMAVDEHGNHVFNDSSEIRVSVQGGGSLVALGNADPKPDKLIPYGGESCQLYEGKAMAIIRSETGSKGCFVNVESSAGIKSQTSIRFLATETRNAPVADIKPGAIDLPLSELISQGKAHSILRKFLGQLVDSDMFASVQNLSLKKLMSMNGTPIPAEITDALEKAVSRC